MSISSATKKWKTSSVFLPPKLSGYLRNAEGTNNINFLAEDEKLLRKTIKYGVKFKILRGKNWLIITKTKFHHKKVSINSHCKVTENGSECI